MLTINPSAPRLVLAMALATLSVAAHGDEVAETFDTEWIMLTGEVETVFATGFQLDYGEDEITVELDKFDWEVEKSVLPGERVTVTGKMDRNLYMSKSIEAATVHIPRLNEYIYADPADEEGDPSVVRSFAPGLYFGPDDGDWLTFSGRVTNVDGDEITVESLSSTFVVDTSPVPGDLVSPSVDVGDSVLVTGEMDAADLFDAREVEAYSVTKLNDRSY